MDVFKFAKVGAVPLLVMAACTIVSRALKSAILVVSLAFLIYPPYAESQAVARIAMIAITTISSINVKPDCLRIIFYSMSSYKLYLYLSSCKSFCNFLLGI